MLKKPVLADPQTCGSCRYYHGNRADEYGYCRRFPPVASIQDGAAVTLWPVVTLPNWCGEFDRKLNS